MLSNIRVYFNTKADTVEWTNPHSKTLTACEKNIPCQYFVSLSGNFSSFLLLCIQIKATVGGKMDEYAGADSG